MSNPDKILYREKDFQTGRTFDFCAVHFDEKEIPILMIFTHKPRLPNCKPEKHVEKHSILAEPALSYGYVQAIVYNISDHQPKYDHPQRLQQFGLFVPGAPLSVDKRQRRPRPIFVVRP